MTGMFGIRNGVVGHAGVGADLRPEGAGRKFRSRLSTESLPGVLRQAGYYTASISPFADRHGQWGFLAGFRENIDTGYQGMESAELVTPTVLDWLNRRGKEEDWFLHVNFWDPHMPSRAPMEEGNPFAEDPLPSWYSDELVEGMLARPGQFRLGRKEEIYRFYRSGQHPKMREMRPDGPECPRCPETIRTLADVRAIVDGYDCGVRYMDAHLGRILNTLADLGVLSDTLIVASADHGENLGELDIFGDHVTADQITTRVPLIASGPGVKSGVVEGGLHYHLDLAPTLAEWVGAPAPEIWDGRSYAETLRKGTSTGRDALVLSTCAGTCQRSVRWGDWLYIRTYHDGYNFFPKEMLFDIGHDPRQAHNLASARPDLCQRGAGMLLSWHDDVMARQPYGAVDDPLWTVLAEGGPSHVRDLYPDYLAYLEANGMADAAEQLRCRPDPMGEYR